MRESRFRLLHRSMILVIVLAGVAGGCLVYLRRGVPPAPGYRARIVASPVVARAFLSATSSAILAKQARKKPAALGAFRRLGGPGPDMPGDHDDAEKARLGRPAL